MTTTVEDKRTEAPEEFMDYRMSRMEKQIDDMAQDIRDVRTNIYNLDVRLNSKIDLKFDQLDSKIDLKIDQLDSKLNARMDKIEDRLWLLLVAVAFSILVPVMLRFWD